MSTKTRARKRKGGYPDGVEPASGPDSVEHLIALERAVWVQTQKAVLVQTVARITCVPGEDIVVPLMSRTQRGHDARRIAVALSAAWLKGEWHPASLAVLWNTVRPVICNGLQKHRDLMETDRPYRALVERVAKAVAHAGCVAHVTVYGEEARAAIHEVAAWLREQKGAVDLFNAGLTLAKEAER